FSAGRWGGAELAIEASRHDTGDGGLAGPALAGKDVAVSDAALGDGIFECGFDVLLADEFRKRLRAVFAGYDLIHLGGLARPRVIRGTRVKPLPLLPSGPGGVRSRPLHEARSLTFYRIKSGRGWRRFILYSVIRATIFDLGGVVI